MKDKHLYRFYPLPHFDELPESIKTKIELGKDLNDIFNSETSYELLSSAAQKLYSLYNLVIHKQLHLANITTFNDPTESIIDMQKEVAKYLNLDVTDNHYIVSNKKMKLARIDVGKEFVSKQFGIACFTTRVESQWGQVWSL